MGCVIQMNKGSVFGKFGRGAQKASVPLLNYELIHCIASDAHSPFRRTPWLGDIQSFLIEKYDEEYAHRMLQENPYRIIIGQKIVSYAVNPRNGNW
jgi:protein-tyrosine phosphatase